MPHTLARNLVHCVFSTKGRFALIRDPQVLWRHLGVIAYAKNIALVTAGGTANHVHILLALSPTMTLANAIQNLKAHPLRFTLGCHDTPFGLRTRGTFYCDAI